MSLAPTEPRLRPYKNADAADLPRRPRRGSTVVTFEEDTDVDPVEYDTLRKWPQLARSVAWKLLA